MVWLTRTRFLPSLPEMAVLATTTATAVEAAGPPVVVVVDDKEAVRVRCLPRSMCLTSPCPIPPMPHRRCYRPSACATCTWCRMPSCHVCVHPARTRHRALRSSSELSCTAPTPPTMTLRATTTVLLLCNAISMPKMQRRVRLRLRLRRRRRRPARSVQSVLNQYHRQTSRQLQRPRSARSMWSSR